MLRSGGRCREGVRGRIGRLCGRRAVRGLLTKIEGGIGAGWSTYAEDVVEGFFLHVWTFEYYSEDG